MNNCKVIDLFCGIGGLAHGFKLENFDIVAGFDTDETCKFAFEHNNNAIFYATDVKNITKNDIDLLFNNAKIKILVGCAPCQPFSSYAFKNKETENEKWSLLYHFARIIKETSPDIISMENVSQLLNFNKAPVFKDFIESLNELGYHVSYQIVNCSDYGIPQSRRRLVLLASKLGKIKLIEKTHNHTNYVTVRNTIEHLPKIQDGVANETDSLHQARKLSALNKKRIKNTPLNGGSWKDWDKELVLECHKKNSGKTYPSVYGRMEWDKPSPTMTTHCTGYGNGRFGHPEQDRAISIREAALFQTFPLDYKFFPNNEFSTIKLSRQLGNAVPVELGKVIAKSISEHIKEYKKS